MTRRLFIPLIVATALAGSMDCRAAEYFVAPGGNNANPGTAGSPWRTVAKATSTAVAGDTVFFRAGTYNERLVAPRSGTPANPIAFRAFAAEIPVLDGTGLAFSFDAGMVDIRNKSHLVIDGFEIRNLVTADTNKVPVGVYIHGDPFTAGTAPTNIVIENCRVHGIRNTHGSDGNAHGIIARGEIASALTAIVVRDNEVFDNTLGFSEALVVNGNVDGFEIRGNTVRDNDNIGIDIIGFEGSLPPTIDFARNGVVSDNLVFNCTSSTNPLYGFGYSAGGIYVDGGALTVIERNRVYECDIGIEIASEAPGRSTRDITVRDNILWRNAMGGIFTGGYAAGLGSTNNCTITHNTLYQNDTLGWSTGEILIRDSTHILSIRNNLVVASSQNVLVQRNSSNSSAITMDYNLFFSHGSQHNSEWQWNTGGGDGFVTGFSDFRAASGTNANSLWANPLFANTSGAVGGYDFSLPANSPAHDAGDPTFTAAPGETDIAGHPRVVGARVDSGAYEFLTVLQAWRFQHFGVPEGAGEAANTANPDHDALGNLLEFILDELDPTVPDTSDAQPDLDAATGDFTFRLREGAPDTATLRVQATTDLDRWADIATLAPGGAWTSLPGVTVTTDATRTVRVHDSRPVPPEAPLVYRIGASE